MKNFLLLITLITLSFKAISNPVELSREQINELGDGEITDEQALDLGMTPVENIETKRTSLFGAGELDGPMGFDLDRRTRGNFEFKDSDLDRAEIVIVVNKGVRSSSNPNGQTIRVYKGGVYLYEFDTSTGLEKTVTSRTGKVYRKYTPIGAFRVKRAYKEYQSYAYFGAPMDYAMFIYGGIALHSTSPSYYSKLGTRASGGCARMRLEDSITLSELIRSTGEGHSRMSSEGFQGLQRNKYTDRIKLNDIARFSADETNKVIWTYDAVVFVVDKE